jgi:predicted dinucleotide-binding enzyme
MKVGILGPGRIGGNLGRYWAQAGHTVKFGYYRDTGKVEQLLKECGPNASAGSTREAVEFGEVVLLAMPWTTLDAALKEAGSLAGKVVIDATNPYNADFSLAVRTGSSLEVARRIPGARVVKAYNTIYFKHLEEYGGGQVKERRFIPYCGDDAQAKAVVARLIEDSGFAPLDTGALADAVVQEPQGPLYNRPMTLEQARAVLREARGG